MNKSLLLIQIIFFYSIIFSAHAQHQDSLKIILNNFNDSTPDSSIFINIDFPQIDGLENKELQTKINLFLEEEFKQSLEWYEEMKLDSTLFEIYDFKMQFSYETGYEVTYNSKEFLSIILSHYQFTGGAHGNYFALGYNINLSDGSLLSLKDIIQEGSLDILEYECEQSILEKFEANSLMEAGLFENEIVIPTDQDFFIIPGSLVIQFDPYEVGPWVMGEITAEISFDKIKDILKEDLPFNLE